MALPRFDIRLNREERLPAALLLMFFVALCVAGGASREDVLAPSVIRGLAVVAMLVQVAFGQLPDLRRYRACAWLLGAMMAIVVVQLIPLPPALWTALPGRGLVASAPIGASMWRPINLVPDAGWNALFSLLVPLCVLVLASSLAPETVRRARYIVIGAIVFSALFALLQASGSVPDNALINGSTVDYAGVFANRNHQALFLAIGIALLWFWGLGRRTSSSDRKLWLALCLILMLAIGDLLTGSRTGLILEALAIVVAPPLAIMGDGSQARGLIGKPIFWIVTAVLLAGVIVAISIYFGRSQSLDRAAALNIGDDFRLRALPTSWQIAKAYFPFGAGMGSFDAVFRSVEPFALLEPTYFNHAHNDLLETVIETGIFGPIVFGAVAIWTGRTAWAIKSREGEAARWGRASVLIAILVIIASISDYPARTPMIMAVLTLSGCWLADSTRKSQKLRRAGALPSNPKSL